MSNAQGLSMTRQVVSYEADDETWVPQAEHRRLQFARNTETRMPAGGTVSSVVFGPRFAKEIGMRLTEGLGSGLPHAVSERLRKARELAIAKRRK